MLFDPRNVYARRKTVVGKRGDGTCPITTNLRMGCYDGERDGAVPVMIPALLAGITALFAAAFVVACCQVSGRESRKEEAQSEYHDSDTAGYQEEQPADMQKR